VNDADNESPLAPSGKQQIYVPRRELVCSFNGGAGGNTQTDLFLRMKIPDSRLICKFTLRASSRQTAPDALVLAGRALNLWLYEEEADQARGKRYAPCTDLAGSTSAAPIAFPANAALGGFSREFITSADAIGARLRITVQAPGGVQGDVYMQARFQPAVGRYIPPEEWEQVKSRCGIEVLSGPLEVL